MPLALLAHLELPSMDSTESRDFFIAGLGAVVSSLTGLQINIGATQIHLRPSIDSHLARLVGMLVYRAADRHPGADSAKHSVAGRLGPGSSIM